MGMCAQAIGRRGGRRRARRFSVGSCFIPLLCWSLLQGCTTPHPSGPRTHGHTRAPPHADIALMEHPSTFGASSVSPPAKSKERIRWSGGVGEWTVTLPPVAAAHAQIRFRVPVRTVRSSERSWLTLEFQPNDLAGLVSVDLLAEDASSHGTTDGDAVFRSAKPLASYAVARANTWGFYVLPLRTFLPLKSGEATADENDGRWGIRGIRLYRTDANGPPATMKLKLITLRYNCFAIPPHYHDGEIEGAVARFMP